MQQYWSRIVLVILSAPLLAVFLHQRWLTPNQRQDGQSLEELWETCETFCSGQDVDVAMALLVPELVPLYLKTLELLDFKTFPQLHAGCSTLLSDFVVSNFFPASILSFFLSFPPSLPPSLSHSPPLPPSLMWPQCFATATVNAFTSGSCKRPDLSNAPQFSGIK